MMCNICEWFYQGQKANIKPRIRKYKPDVLQIRNALNIFAIVVE